MSMGYNSLVGCCAARWIYGLGGAESFPVFHTQAEFDDDMARMNPNQINICVTNSDQINARKFLKEQGWNEQPYGERLILHSISNTTLRKYLADAKAKRLEENARVAKERQEKLMKEKQGREALEAARFKAPPPAVPVKQIDISEIADRLANAGFWQDSPFHNDQDERTTFKRKLEVIYGIKLRGLMTYENAEHIKNAINLQLRNKANG